MQDCRYETPQRLEYWLEVQMNAWFAKNLGDAMLAWDSLDRIETLYTSLYGGVDGCRDIAVFIRHESEGRLHCEVMAYFSPDAFLLAAALDAAPCKRPLKHDLSLHVGSGDSWQTLFDPCNCLPERNFNYKN